MSWDLHPEEMIDKASSLPVTQTPEVGVFHNFMEGAAKVAMQGFAKTARAVDLLGAVGPIVEDWATDVRTSRALGSVPATMPKTVTAQDRYFKEHDAMFQSAVDYWTPRPNEVGVAGEVAGSLLSMLPTIMASPALAVGATQLAQGQDLVREGVDPGKAQAVGAVQALGLGAGIWMPILGTNALQRIVIGGAGFNVVQGVSTRAASKAILEGDKAAEQFRPLGGTELTLDILLGLAFGTMAHINPAQRAQGAKAWEDIGNFLKDSPPSDKAALATLREAQHINLDSLPGTPQTAADLDVHVQRMRAAIESLATDKPVDVENIVVEQTAPQIQTLEERLDAHAAERTQMAMERQNAWENGPEGMPMPRSTPLEDALATASAAGVADFNTFLRHIKNAIDAGRVDVAQSLVERAERYARNSSTTPGVPEGHQKYEAIKADLEQRKINATEEAEKLRSEFEAAKEAAGIQSDVPTSNQPRYNPDMARIEQDTAIREAIESLATDKPVDVENIVKDPQQVAPLNEMPDKTGTLPPVPEGMIRLYRGESAKVGDVPDWVMQGLKENGSLNAQGRWWSQDLEIANWYKNDAGENGRVVWQDVPADVVAKAQVSTLDDMVKKFSLDPANEFFLPAEYVGKGNPMEPRYNPDMARIEQDTAIREAIQEHAKTVAAEEGIPQIPDRKTIAQTIEEQLVQAGRPAEEAKAGATLWQAFFDTTASRYGRTGQELFDRYMKGITGELTSEAMLAQKSLLDKMKDMQPQVESAKAAMDKIIQDQRELEGLRAAMRDPLTGKIYTGWSHQGAIATVPQWKPGMPTDGPEFGTWGRLNAEWDRGTDNTGFIDRDGKFISRTEAEKRWNVLTMEDVRDAKKKNGTLFQGAVPWYHSELDRQIGTAKMNSASPKDWKNYIKGLSNKGVKAEEVKWSGLEDWLDLQPGKVTKEQIQQFMKEGGVKVEETTLGEQSQTMQDIRKEIGTLRDDILEKQRQFQDSGYLYREVTTEIFNELPPEWQAKYEELNGIRDRYNKLADQERDDSSPTKFATYQLPGGENYRELLLTLPEKVLPRDPEQVLADIQTHGYGAYEDNGTWHLMDANDEAIDKSNAPWPVQKLLSELDGTGDAPKSKNPASFRSGHFDQPNILAHIRFNERTDADGKKVLFIEEIQSDWAQKGKKEGFNVKPEIVEKKVGDRTVYQVISRGEVFSEETTRATAELVAAEENNHLNGVPSAPFVGKTEAWVGLSLKRMIRYAAENGFDRVAWTNGEQQAARYDLSKQVDKIVVTPRTDPATGEKTRSVAIQLPQGNLLRFGVDANGVIDNTSGAQGMGDAKGKPLEDVIGKEMAKRVMETDRATFEGLDLKVGGDGMKAFYDRIVPNVANDVLKKLGGGRVGEVTIDQQGMRAATAGAPDEAWPYAIYVGDREVNRIGTRRVAEQEVADLREQGKDARIVQLLDTTTKQPGFDITPSMREKAMETQALFQPERGALQFEEQGKMAIALLKSADPSTFLHESGHFFLEVTNDLASQPDAPAAMKQDMQTLYSWFGLKDADTWNNMTLDEKRPYHEQFARGFERYLRDGQAPTPVLKGLFQRFRDWLKAVYQSASQLNVEVSDQVRAVMDRMLAEPQRTEAPPEATRSATPPPPRGGVGEPMGEALVLTEVQQVREDIMAAEHTARQRWGDAIIDALYEKYAPHLEDAGQLRGMSAIMESLAEDAKPSYLMKTMGPRPKEPQSLIAAIKELGGINTSMRSDIAGPDKKGVPVSLFRKAGKNVDELALLLQEKGFLNEADIANESDNGGINKLMEMIQDEIGGNKHYSERDATQAAALREHDQFMESIDGKGESASTHFTPEEWATIQREVIAEGMAPTAKNVVDADAVSIAMQIDEARVERAAITAADDFDFMAEVREIIDGYKPQPDATAAERGAAPAAKPGTPGPAGQEANAPGADRNAGNQGVIAQQAIRMVAENPDLPIATGVDAQGNTTYQKASEYLAEAKAMADLKRQDVSLFELAAQCLLGGGR